MAHVTLRLDEDQLAALDRAAERERNTRTGILRLALDRYLGTEKRPAAQQLVAKPLAFASGDDRCPSCRRLGIELCRHRE